MRKIAQLVVLALLPLLAGCFEARQDIVIASDGTVTLTTEIAVAPPEALLALLMPPELLALMTEEELAAAAADFEQDADFCAPEEGDLPEGFTATEMEWGTREDGYQFCRTTMTGPIALLLAVLADISDGDDLQLAITDEGGGVYLFSITVPPTDDGGDELALLGEEMLAMMIEQSIIWTLTASAILETNGEVDGNTAIFVLPAAVLLGADHDGYDFMVRFSVR